MLLQEFAFKDYIEKLFCFWACQIFELKKNLVMIIIITMEETFPYFFYCCAERKNINFKLGTNILILFQWKTINVTNDKVNWTPCIYIYQRIHKI